MTAAVAEQRRATGSSGSPCAYCPDPAVFPPPPCWVAQAPQRARLELAAAVLRRHGILATPAPGRDPERTRRQVEELGRRFPDGARSYLFWTVPDGERCFDDSGDLVEDLPLYHPTHLAAAVAAVLEQVGMSASQLPDGRTTVARRLARPPACPRRDR